MTLRFPVAISVLCLSSLATFADGDKPTPDQALAQNRDVIKEQVASLNSELAKFIKVLKDDTVSPDDKASTLRKMYGTFLCGYPKDVDELVQALSQILKDEKTTRSGRKWILQCLLTMGTKGSKAEGAIEHHVKNGSDYKALGMNALGAVAPKNALFQERMKEILTHPEVPDPIKEDAAVKLVIAGNVDTGALKVITDSATKRGELSPPILLFIAGRAEGLPEADRKLLLGAIKESSKKSYKGHVKNYFREKMQGNTAKAMEHYAESLKVKSMESTMSFNYLSLLNKAELKLLAPVLIDFLKKGRSHKSIAFLLADLK